MRFVGLLRVTMLMQERCRPRRVQHLQKAVDDHDVWILLQHSEHDECRHGYVSLYAIVVYVETKANNYRGRLTSAPQKVQPILKVL